MKLVWNGQSEALVIGLGTVTPGKTYEVEDELGSSLIESHDGWKEATTKKSDK